MGGKSVCPVVCFFNSLLALRWVRFGLVGAAATAAYFLCGLVFVKILGLPLLAGNACAYALGFIVSYSGQKRWTFASKGSTGKSLPKFALAQLAGLCLNSIIVDWAVRLGAAYEFAMLLATVLVPVAVYFICKLWVFRPGPEERT